MWSIKCSKLSFNNGIPVVALWVWITFCVIYSEFFFVAITHVFFVKGIFRNQFNFFANGLVHNYILYVLLKSRKNIKSTLLELRKWLLQINKQRYFAIVKRLKVVFLIIVAYSFVVTLLGIELSRDWYEASIGDPKNESLRQDLLAFFCFNCDTSKSPKWLHEFAIYMDIVFYPLVTLTLFLLVSTPYCVMARIISELLVEFQSKMEDTNLVVEGSNELRKVMRYLLQVYHLSTEVNAVFRNVILLWYGVTLICSCERIVMTIELLLEYNHDWCTSMYLIVYSFQDLAFMGVFIFIASRVKRESEKCYSSATLLIDRAVSPESMVETILLFMQLNANRIELKAGSCFTISCRSFLSFLGLGLTYTVIYLQFSPKVLAIVQR